MAITKIKSNHQRNRRVQNRLRRLQAHQQTCEFVTRICRQNKENPRQILVVLREARRIISADKAILAIKRGVARRKLDGFIEALSAIIESDRRAYLGETDPDPLSDLDQWGHITRCP